MFFFFLFLFLILWLKGCAASATITVRWSEPFLILWRVPLAPRRGPWNGCWAALALPWALVFLVLSVHLGGRGRSPEEPQKTIISAVFTC